MTATINYDQRVENLIDELSRTGHVTHSKWKKKSVTLHHNGGVRFTHQTILNIWRTRPASAHFDVDQYGAVAQYVDVHEYAWAVGNTLGNEETISIEMADLSAHWEVSEATWRSAARLSGWLFEHVIGERPTRDNFFPHRHWSATSCPGPYVMSVWGHILQLAQQSYDHFHGSAPKPVTRNVVVDIQGALEVTADGKWGPATDRRAQQMRAACHAHAGYPRNYAYLFDTRLVQAIIDVTQDAVWGPKSQAALVNWLKGFQHILGVTADGRWGPGTEDRYQKVRGQHRLTS